MNFFDRKRLVAFALSMVVLLSVALGHTIPDSSVESTPESLVEHVEEPVGKPVAISENLAGPIGSPPFVVSCTVDVASYGVDDSVPCGYVRTSGGSSEVIFDPNDISKNRGVTLFELDPTTCTTLNRQRFDTWGVADDRVQLVETLESASAGTIIIGVTADSAETESSAFRNSVNWYFTKYNMNLYGQGLGLRDKFAFIMQKGYPKKTIFYRQRRYGSCLEKSFTLRGSKVSDLKFY